MLNKLKKRVIEIEKEYKRLFSTTVENEQYITFTDTLIHDMYSHNFTYVINPQEETLTPLLQKLIDERVESKSDFLQVEFDSEIDFDYSSLSRKPRVSKTDYMIIDLQSLPAFKYNINTVVKLADNDDVMNDGIEIDVLANGPVMEFEWARKRINRKALAYRKEGNLYFYVAYSKGEVIGNCEMLISGDVVKVEDFDIFEDYQRKGHGSAFLHRLMQKAIHNECKYMYLITDRDDSAKEMYKKCGFDTLAFKQELYFNLKEK